jgi:hypothetical protein
VLYSLRNPNELDKKKAIFLFFSLSLLAFVFPIVLKMTNLKKKKSCIWSSPKKICESPGSGKNFSISEIYTQAKKKKKYVRLLSLAEKKNWVGFIYLF